MIAARGGGALLAIATIAVSLAIALFALAPPAVAPASAAATDFSAERALRHVEAIAARPHRMGSPAHDDVRAYIVNEASALGLATEVQETSVAQLRWAHRTLPRIATVKNVVARLRGTDGGPAVALMAHYDSRSMTPGAGDDAAGVAVLLETARALVAGPRRRHDVLFVFTDGEEHGLLGSKAFREEHPAAREVAVLVNFDARGDRGPAFVFQTSDRAAHLLALVARTPHPKASSLSQAVYKRMPNDTDVTEWLATNVDAINVANIGGVENYHSPTDTPANLDPRTVQHMGSYALPLARALADAPLPLVRDGDATYFNAGPIFVRYSARADVPIAIAAALFAIAIAVVAVRRGRARLGALVLGAGIAIAIVVASSVASGVVWSLAHSAHVDYAMVAAARSALKDRWGAAFVMIPIAIACGALALARLRSLEVGLGAACVVGVLGIVVAVALPGAGWCLAWSVVGAVLPLAIALRRGESRVLDAATSVVPVVLLTPIAVTLYAAFGPAGAAIVTAIVALALVLASPALALVVTLDRRAIAAAVAAIAAIALAWATPPFDRASPRPTTLFFATDLDARRSWWASPDAPNEWTSKVLEGGARAALPSDMFEIEADATVREEPFAEVEGARVDVVARDAKHLEARVVPPPNAELLVVRVSGATRGEVEGRAVPAKNGVFGLHYSAPPRAGFTMKIDLDGSPVKLSIAAQRPGFPRAVADAPGARPDTMMPKPGMLEPWDEMQESDMTVSVQRVAL